MPIQTVQFRNTSEHVLNPPGLDLGEIQPGAIVEVPLALCAPTILDNRSRGKSPIEKNAPQLRPVDPEFEAHWAKTPQPLAPVSRVVSTQRRAPVDPPGVVAARAAATRASAKNAAQANTGPKAPALTPATGPKEKTLQQLLGDAAKDGD